jgi:hypothetical protein
MRGLTLTSLYKEYVYPLIIQRRERGQRSNSISRVFLCHARVTWTNTKLLMRGLTLTSLYKEYVHSLIIQRRERGQRSNPISRVFLCHAYGNVDESSTTFRASTTDGRERERI